MIGPASSVIAIEQDRGYALCTDVYYVLSRHLADIYLYIYISVTAALMQQLYRFFPEIVLL
jgi:hypothetical protein